VRSAARPSRLRGTGDDPTLWTQLAAIEAGLTAFVRAKQLGISADLRHPQEPTGTHGQAFPWYERDREMFTK